MDRYDSQNDGCFNSMVAVIFGLGILLTLVLIVGLIAGIYLALQNWG